MNTMRRQLRERDRDRDRLADFFQDLNLYLCLPL